MNTRLIAFAALGREVVLPASVLACIVASGLAGIDHGGAAPLEGGLAPSLTADFADKTPVIPSAASGADAGNAADVKITTAATTPASPEPEPAVSAALNDPSETPPPTDTSPLPTAAITVASADPGDIVPRAGSTETPEQCAVVDSCVDRYLWSLYQRAPKEDNIQVEQQRQVTVKKKGKMVTVTRTFSTSAAEDFSWKDPKAADKAGLPLQDYVIGGMDRDFKLRLFHLLQYADQAGLSPGITSAFRDDYRQSIASGLKAADNRSYHGGSIHGGYGHGLAADVVSVNGATRAERLTSTENFWKWIDSHGQEFGIGRPYLDRDPPHVAPIDGKEYADHHPGMKAHQARSAAKTKTKAAAGEDHGPTKHARVTKPSKVRTS